MTDKPLKSVVQEEDVSQSEVAASEATATELELAPYELEAGEEESSVTLKDMLKLHYTDIKSASRIELLKQLVCFSASILLREGSYRD